MGLIPDGRPLSDGQIRECWARALRWNQRGSLSRKLAGATCDELEAAGVTGEDIDRAMRPEEESMGRRKETTTLRASLAGYALADYKRRNPEQETPQHVVQLLADLRILCGRDGLDAGFLFELSEAHAKSYPAP